jgi:hypothetical protein
MIEDNKSPTKALFDNLAKLYKQGQLLFMDADRLMGERGWVSMSTTAPSGFSYSVNAPERWYARWAVRFYISVNMESGEPSIDRILFVSIHFTSDMEAGLPTTVDEPLVSAGRLIYNKPMTSKVADRNHDYYMCKYWFFGKPHNTLKGWRKTVGSKFSENLQGSETFIVPLYRITSSEKLKKLVIDPLLAVQDKEKRIT